MENFKTGISNLDTIELILNRLYSESLRDYTRFAGESNFRVDLITASSNRNYFILTSEFIGSNRYFRCFRKTELARANLNRSKLGLVKSVESYLEDEGIDRTSYCEYLEEYLTIRKVIGETCGSNL